MFAEGFLDEINVNIISYNFYISNAGRFIFLIKHTNAFYIILESYSSRIASDSLSSSTDDNVMHHNIESNNWLSPLIRHPRPGSTSSDRGYFTSKCFPKSGVKRIAVNHRRWKKVPPSQRPRSCLVMTSSGMSTLTDTGTGAWMSSTATRRSSFSSSRNNSFARPGHNYSALRQKGVVDNGGSKFTIPDITLTSAGELQFNRSKEPAVQQQAELSYMVVLDSYLHHDGKDEHVYDQLLTCVSTAARHSTNRKKVATTLVPAAQARQLLSVEVASKYALVTKNSSPKKMCAVDSTSPGDVEQSSEIEATLSQENVHNLNEINDRNLESTGENEKQSSTERTSDTLINGPKYPCDNVSCTPELQRENILVLNSICTEKNKHHVAVASPALVRRRRIASSEEGVSDEKDVNESTNVCEDCEENVELNDEKLLCVFMEMNV